LISYSGLGAGISASSFARQNIDITVIEIDPAVYNASRQYFGLPDLDSNRVFLEDARVVVADKRRSMQHHGHPNADKYDYVVHDCFSGGGVPAHLFTLQFWEDLKAIMNPEGVVAVVSPSMHYEYSTLISRFTQERRREDKLRSHESNPIYVAEEFRPVSCATRSFR
jgi:spermidine synthase